MIRLERAQGHSSVRHLVSPVWLVLEGGGCGWDWGWGCARGSFPRDKADLICGMGGLEWSHSPGWRDRRLRRLCLKVTWVLGSWEGCGVFGLVGWFARRLFGVDARFGLGGLGRW